MVARLFGALWISVVCISYFVAPAKCEGDDPINIVVINVEQLGWGDVGLYSPWRSDTPNIDKLAETGIILDNLYSETSATASAATFLSGKLAASWGLYSSNNAESTELPEDSGFILPQNLTILPKILKDKGYKTGYVGRWNLGQRPEANPIHFGFDTFLGTVSDIGVKYDDMKFPNVGFYRDENIVGRIFHSNAGLTQDDNLVNQGVSNITRVYAGDTDVFIRSDEKRPFYIHVSLDALKHRPYRSPPFVDSSSGTRATNFTDALREVDDFVGVITKAIKESNLWEKTLVVFAAHSTALASHYNGGSNSPFTGETGDSTEGGVRVPAVISFPGFNFNNNIRSKQLMNFADLHATALSLMGFDIKGCEEPKCVTEGMNMTKSLTTGNTAGSRDTISIYRGRTLMAIRLGRYKAHIVSLSSKVPGQFVDKLTSYKLKNITQPMMFEVVADPGERFFVSDVFSGTSARYTDVLPKMKETIAYIEAHVKLGGGLLNECNILWREWSSPGCSELELCITCSWEGKKRMCTIPEWAQG